MRMRHVIWIAFFAGCGSGNYSAEGPGGGTPGFASGESQQPGGGVLTAGAWDDNQNFDFYLKYLAAVDAQKLPLPAVPRADRRVITVTDADGTPLAGATVAVLADGTSVFETTTGSDGRALFFPTWAGVADRTLTATATLGDGSATGSLDADATLVVGGVSAQATNVIDVAMVIDTTGSMGDEISYLKTEFEGIAALVAQQFPGVDQRWALVVYRDEHMGDDYEVRSTDFTGDLTAFRANLGSQSAGGGGDLPEIPDRGLDTAAGLSWRPGAVARLAFLVADAPPHDYANQRWLDSIGKLRTAGVHVYPIAASGTDDTAEYDFRSAAQLTGGRYLFLTDDSGVGDSHKEPTLPCYLVTKLNLAMARMISMELTGKRIDPAATDVIRTGGDPKDGRCTLTDGQTVSVL
jgi:hypothetical protein